MKRIKNQTLVFFFLQLNLNLNLNPKSITYYQPQDLITAHRFSIMAKYIYAKYSILNAKTNWHKKLYIQHLIARGCWKKLSYKEKLEIHHKFDTLLKTIHEIGFDPAMSLVPICRKTGLIFEGEHRISIGLLLDLKIPTCLKKCNRTYAPRSYFFFKKRGLPQKYLDHMALEYFCIKPQTQLIFCKPSHSDILKELAQTGELIYKKKIFLSQSGINELTRLFAIPSSISNLIDENRKLWIILWTPDTNKASIVEKNHKDVLFCYIQEKELTFSLVKTLLNKNSLQFINQKAFVQNHDFEKTLISFRNWALSQNLNLERFCMLYDDSYKAHRRECQSKSYKILSHSPQPLLVKNTNFTVIGNSQRFDEIIFNPENFFYYQGVKCYKTSLIDKLGLQNME